ncbi:MAG TPA: hypothetical protein VJ998_08620, partial [Pseudomonadales bacterium]|nr:hypothetical protein [Pseudomonadales bacterium]
ADLMERMRSSYEDIIKVSLHRTKTDLIPEQVRILHFGIIKFLLVEVRQQLDKLVGQVEETLSQQQFAGSRSLLVTQERFTWIRKHYSTFQYRVTRAVMKDLQRVETNHLRQLREQFLGQEMPELTHILFNPMLAASSPVDPHLLMDAYAMWHGGSREIGDALASLEAYFAASLPEFKVLALRASRPDVGQTEIYDGLGGLFAAQPIMGASEDQKDRVSESFCWLDHPGNVRLLFDETVHERISSGIEERRAQRGFKSTAKKLLKVGGGARSHFASDAQFKEMVACYVMREDWSSPYDDIVDLPLACAYVAGNDTKKILSRIDQSREGAAALLKEMDEWAKETTRRLKEESGEFTLRMLTDLSRYRLHLKYYRFAHRMFNRVNVITEPQKIQLSKAGGHLYRLVGTDASKGANAAEPEIVHHTILKADVRGSTVVTQELIKQNLNPASYFSTRFFGPITQLLSVYGAVKVFIEGDAVILGIHEYDVDPQQWYSVSRACGIAKEILDLVTSKNANSRQAGIPLLEIGIGICYADEKPLFLFDEDKPIMISPAIGDADRMSSCSWKLREAFSKGHFNVEVLEIAEGERERGEKGQEYLRYNLNGILLDAVAFTKLKSEIRLSKMKVKVGEYAETFYVGKFPDVIGKERDLVVREGLVGVWQNGEVTAGNEGGEVFFEVLPNTKFASQVLELARNQAAKSG